MQIGDSPVSSDAKVIGSAKFPIFETLDEAVNDDTHGFGEQRLLDIINAQVKTNAMNALRTERTKGPTKSALRGEAMNEIVSEIANGEHSDVIGNREALESLTIRRMAQIEQRMEETREALIGSDEAE